MKYTGSIYRPPIESNTLLLQVTVGCTHNKCRFCTMYKDVEFTVESLEQIEKDLKEAKQNFGDQNRIFLVNGDAFVLSAEKLKPIAELIIKYFPNMEVITMYASIRNIMTKTDQELKELRDMRINDLWIGLETGHASALENLNKGFTPLDSYEHLKRLNRAGIRHNAILMLGAGGSGKSIESAIDTAKLINKTNPSLVGVTPLGFWGESELSQDIKNGDFIPATELEIFEEEKKLLELIDIENIPFYGDHVLNSVIVRGTLPRDKEAMIKKINEAISNCNEHFLNGVAKRSSL